MAEQKPTKGRPSGGLYRNVKVPVFFLNIAICVGMAALAAVIVFLSVKGGFSVTFDTSGGSGVSSQTVRYGKMAEMPADPEKTGYTFGGWYLDAELTRKWNAEKNLIEQDTVLYAKWIPVSVKVLFDPDGGAFESETAPHEKTVTFGEPYGELPIPYKEGFLFGGWHYNDAIVMENTTVKANGEHVLKAFWKESVS